MEGNAKGSPRARGIRDIETRVQRIERFEKWGCVRPLNLRELVGDKSWNAYWADLDVIIEKMVEAQAHAARVRALVHKALEEQKLRK
jgi:hypothetical protein